MLRPPRAFNDSAFFDSTAGKPGPHHARNGRQRDSSTSPPPPRPQRSPPWRAIPTSPPRPNGRHHGGQSRHHHRDPTVATMAGKPAITTATQRSPPWRPIPPSPRDPTVATMAGKPTITTATQRSPPWRPIPPSPRDPWPGTQMSYPSAVLPVDMNAHLFSTTENQLLYARGRYPATPMLPPVVTRVSASCQEGHPPLLDLPG